MELYLGAGVLVLLLLSHWLTYRKGVSRGTLKAKAADARLRAEAGKASLEAYLREKEAQARRDPITGKPDPPG